MYNKVISFIAAALLTAASLPAAAVTMSSEWTSGSVNFPTITTGFNTYQIVIPNVSEAQPGRNVLVFADNPHTLNGLVGLTAWVSDYNEVTIRFSVNNTGSTISSHADGFTFYFLEP